MADSLGKIAPRIWPSIEAAYESGKDRFACDLLGLLTERGTRPVAGDWEIFHTVNRGYVPGV